MTLYVTYTVQSRRNNVKKGGVPSWMNCSDDLDTFREADALAVKWKAKMPHKDFRVIKTEVSEWHWYD
jgi:hypothetical protein